MVHDVPSMQHAKKAASCSAHEDLFCSKVEWKESLMLGFISLQVLIRCGSM